MSIFIAATYLLSFADRNPWLASLAIAGFAWFVIGLQLTHRAIALISMTSDGRIQNRDGETKYGLRFEGSELPDIPPYGTLRVKLSPQLKRYRISTFSPSGFFYAWTFQKTNRTMSSDLGETTRYFRGSPWARVDWKLWFRRGRFLATPQDPHLHLRPSELLSREALRKWSFKNLIVASDASIWALLFSFILFLTLAVTNMYLAPLWAGIILLLWVVGVVAVPLSKEKFRHWGRVNFFISWIFMVLVLVTGKALLEPWMISTWTVAILFIPFALYFKLTSSDDIMRRLMRILGIAALTLIFLYAARSFIADRFQSRNFYGSGVGSDINWNASLSSDTLNTAEKFLVRGQPIFWVDYPKNVHLAYESRLPYWREATYTESLQGINWYTKVQAADAGIPIAVNLFLPGRDSLQLQREPPSTQASPAQTAHDSPNLRPLFIFSRRARELVRTLRLDPNLPLESADKIIAWMKSENFEYSLRPGKIVDIDQFLFHRKVGLCQHYAGAVAYLLRAVNISARVVAGYQGGEVDYDQETLLMRDYDAHAWVEVWDPKVQAWMLVDPTATLFPAEYRVMPRMQWMDPFTRAIVTFQKHWANVQNRVGMIGVTLGGILTLILLWFSIRRVKRPRKVKVVIATLPKVQAWEEKMQKHFHKPRYSFEGLSGYYERVVSQAAISPPHVLQLKQELAELITELYAT